MIESIIKLLGVSKNSYWNYKKQERPIIKFLEKYFTEEELNEYLETGGIKRLDQTTDENIELMMIEYSLFNIQDKLNRTLFEPSFFEWGKTAVPKEIFINILQDLNTLNVEVNKYKAKEFLIEKIHNYKHKSQAERNKADLIEIIEKNFSNLECYVLIKYVNQLDLRSNK